MARLVLKDMDGAVEDVVTTQVPLERALLEAQGYRRSDLDAPALTGKAVEWQHFVSEQYGVPADVTADMKRDALIEYHKEHDDRPEPPQEPEAGASGDEGTEGDQSAGDGAAGAQDGLTSEGSAPVA